MVEWSVGISSCSTVSLGRIAAARGFARFFLFLFLHVARKAFSQVLDAAVSVGWLALCKIKSGVESSPPNKSNLLLVIIARIFIFGLWFLE